MDEGIRMVLVIFKKETTLMWNRSRHVEIMENVYKLVVPNLHIFSIKIRGCFSLNSFKLTQIFINDSNRKSVFSQ